MKGMTVQLLCLGITCMPPRPQSVVKPLAAAPAAPSVSLNQLRASQPIRSVENIKCRDDIMSQYRLNITISHISFVISQCRESRITWYYDIAISSKSWRISSFRHPTMSSRLQRPHLYIAWYIYLVMIFIESNRAMHMGAIVQVCKLSQINY